MTIIFDIFNFYLTQGWNEKLLELEKTLNQEDLKRFIYELGHPSKLQTFLFDFDLVDILFRLKAENVRTICYSRYNKFTTGRITAKLGVNELFSDILLQGTEIKTEMPIFWVSAGDGPNWTNSIRINSKENLTFDNIWAKILDN